MGAATSPTSASTWRSVPSSRSACPSSHWNACTCTPAHEYANYGGCKLRLTNNKINDLKVDVKHVDHLRELLSRAVRRGRRLPPIVDTCHRRVERLA